MLWNKKREWQTTPFLIRQCPYNIKIEFHAIPFITSSFSYSNVQRYNIRQLKSLSYINKYLWNIMTRRITTNSFISLVIALNLPFHLKQTHTRDETSLHSQSTALQKLLHFPFVQWMLIRNELHRNGLKSWCFKVQCVNLSIQWQEGI